MSWSHVKVYVFAFFFCHCSPFPESLQIEILKLREHIVI